MVENNSITQLLDHAPAPNANFDRNSEVSAYFSARMPWVDVVRVESSDPFSPRDGINSIQKMRRDAIDKHTHPYLFCVQTSS